MRANGVNNALNSAAASLVGGVPVEHASAPRLFSQSASSQSGRSGGGALCRCSSKSVARYTAHASSAGGGGVWIHQTCGTGHRPRSSISRKPLSTSSGIYLSGALAKTLCAAASLACGMNGPHVFAFFGGGVHQPVVLPSGLCQRSIPTVSSDASPASRSRPRPAPIPHRQGSSLDGGL